MKEHLQRIAKAAAGWLPDALMAGGAAAFSYGGWLVNPPMGWMCAGLFALAGGWLLARGAK